MTPLLRTVRRFITLPWHIQTQMGARFGVACIHPLDHQARVAWLKNFCSYMLGPEMREEFCVAVAAEKTDLLAEQWPGIWERGPNE